MERLTLPETSGVATVEEILAHPEYPLPPGGQELVRQAYEVARKAHEGQSRKSGEPYFSHPTRVAFLLAELVNDPATIAAGLLHDVIEDCDYSVKKLSALFPEPVPQLVDGVTKISSLSFTSDREHQVENLRKMILAMAKDIRVVLIKLCDRLHNMLTLQHLPAQRQREIAQQTLDIYAPLANRIGMTRMRAQLEDLCMSYLHPGVYTKLAKKMALRSERDQYNVDASRELINRALDEKQIPGQIFGRRKHIMSLYKKMRSSGLEFDEVHDIVGFRIITDTVAHCYDILGVVHSLWKPMPGRFKDYIATPKENGYSSIHTSVLGPDGEIFEVQIRTEEMHQAAEDGIAAHWKYKEKDKIGSSVSWGSDEKRLAWVRQLVDWLQDVRDPSEFMRELKRDVYDTSVFVYTPKGDIIEVSQGYTVLDLAYRIHSQIGHSCAAARINNRIASIRTELKTGDIVEIITNKTAHPTADWLQIAHSGRARNKIRHWLKINKRDDYLGHGRQVLLEQARMRLGSSADEISVRQVLEDYLGDFNVESYEDLLVEVGAGSVKTPSVIARLERVMRPVGDGEEDDQKQKPRTPKASPKTRGRRGTTILVDGVAGVSTRMANCCHPMPGDPVIGYVTQSRGITIHREDCNALERLRERKSDADARLVPVSWGEHDQSLKRVTLRLQCNDRKGLLCDLTSAVTQMNISIIAANTSSNLRENRASIKLQVMIESSEQLEILQERLNKIPGVISLSRLTRNRRSAEDSKRSRDRKREAKAKKDESGKPSRRKKEVPK